MSAPKLEALTWALIYGGLLALCVGWFLPSALVMTAGAAVSIAGVVLIVVRSRMKP
jgi:hypothetical protein